MFSDHSQDKPILKIWGRLREDKRPCRPRRESWREGISEARRERKDLLKAHSEVVSLPNSVVCHPFRTLPRTSVEPGGWMAAYILTDFGKVQNTYSLIKVCCFEICPYGCESPMLVFSLFHPACKESLSDSPAGRAESQFQHSKHGVHK